jgi:hypothetical protein
MPRYNERQNHLLRVQRPSTFTAHDDSGFFLDPDAKKLLKKHEQLNQLDMAKVVSHVQRDRGEWVLNTIMLEGYDVPFQYSRKKTYRSLEGARVNLTYYPETRSIAGVSFETMTVVRIRRS